MKAFVDKGFLGRKSGKGFFKYDSKEKVSKHCIICLLRHAILEIVALCVFQGANPDAKELVKPFIRGTGEGIDEKVIQERMVCRFLNEAIRCLEDGIVSSPGDGDIGAVFGIGFPPFYGGPFKYVLCY